MATNLERFKGDLQRLKSDSTVLHMSMVYELEGEAGVRSALHHLDKGKVDKFIAKLPVFRDSYEKWYSECLVLIRQLLPDRLDVFKKQYEKPKIRKDINAESYTIEDYMLGLRASRGGQTIVDTTAALPRLRNQIAILGAIEARFESSIFEIRQLVQADLFDSEITAARELLKHKFLRAAGAIAGVVIEKHLSQVCSDHKITIAKKHPTIGDFNEELKRSNVVDIAQYRHIALLADYRNICVHKRDHEPSEAQVRDLIDGVDKFLKTVL